MTTTQDEHFIPSTTKDIDVMSTPQGPHQQPAHSGPHQGHYGQQYPPPAPQKRRRIWPWVLGGILLVMILGFAGCAALVGGAVNAVDQANGPATVRYELIGEGTVNAVTFANQGGISQTGEAALPWTQDVEFTDSLFAATSLSGQLGQDGGEVTCRVTNVSTGEVIAESTSSGQFAVVSCSGPISDGS